MKKTAITALAFCGATAALLSSLAFAQQKMDDMKSMGMDTKPSTGKPNQQTKTHSATGVVKSVDAATGTVTVAHGPVKTMNWPAMTMGFKVKDKMLLNKFSSGEKVTFEFKQDGKDYVVTSVK